MTDLVVGTNETADVWLDNGHEPDPEIAGPVVACAYEVSWGTPELDAEFPPDTLRKLSAATAQAMARATHIVTGAHISKKQLIDYYRLEPNRVHVFPFGVDQELFHPRRALEGRALVRERTGDDRPYLIFTSAISPRKNLQTVRGALLRVADRGFPHALVIVASDPPGDFDLEALRREAFAEIPGHPGRILQFVDPSDEELASLIAGATAACQPSRFEGFGLPALEAMASGVPVVVSNHAALPEVVGRAGLGGRADGRRRRAGLVGDHGGSGSSSAHGCPGQTTRRVLHVGSDRKRLAPYSPPCGPAIKMTAGHSLLKGAVLVTGRCFSPIGDRWWRVWHARIISTD